MSHGENPLPLHDERAVFEDRPRRQTKRTPARSHFGRGIRLWRRFFTLPLTSELVDLQMRYAEYGYTNAVSSVMCRVRPTHSCTLCTTSVQCSKTDLRGKQNGHPQGVILGGVFAYGEDFSPCRLQASLTRSAAQIRTLCTTSVQCSKTDLGGKQNGHPQGVSVLFGAEGGIRTLVWCYPQTDFESAPL